MFCMYCGTKVADDSKFCSNCGKNIVINNSNASQQQNDHIKKAVNSEQVIFLGHTIDLPLNIKYAGQIYSQFQTLAQSKAQQYVAKTAKENPSLGIFVNRSVRDVADYFNEFFQMALDYLISHGIYIFSLQQIQDASTPYITLWPSLHKELSEISDSHTQKAQAEYAYREQRKNSRGKVIGGGFGLKGAVKGMATAGAINAVTGALHSAVNSVGDAITEKSLTVDESNYFQNPHAQLMLQTALEHDFIGIYYALINLFNAGSPNETLPVYTNEHYIAAANIEQRLFAGDVPDENKTAALADMLASFPISVHFYEVAEEILPDAVNALHTLGEKCGIAYSSKAEKAEICLRKLAPRLCSNPFFIAGASTLGKEPFVKTLDRIVESHRHLLGPLVHVITEKNNQTQKVFNQIPSDETPFLFCDTSATANWSHGIVLTDRMLYGEKRSLNPRGQCAIENLDILIIKDHLFFHKDDYKENQRLNNIVVSELIHCTDIQNNPTDGSLLNQLFNFTVDWILYQRNRIPLYDDIAKEICQRSDVDYNEFKIAMENPRPAVDMRTQRIDAITNEILKSHFQKIQKSYSQVFLPCGSLFPFKKKDRLVAFVKDNIKNSDELELFFYSSGLGSKDIVLFSTKALYIKDAAKEVCTRLPYEEIHSMTVVKEKLLKYCYVNKTILLPCYLGGNELTELCDDMITYVIPFLRNKESE